MITKSKNIFLSLLLIITLFISSTYKAVLVYGISSNDISNGDIAIQSVSISASELQVGDYISGFGEFHGRALVWRVVLKKDMNGDGIDEIMLRTDRALSNNKGWGSDTDDNAVHFYYNLGLRPVNGDSATQDTVSSYINSALVDQDDATLTETKRRQDFGTNYYEQSLIKPALNDFYDKGFSTEEKAYIDIVPHKIRLSPVDVYEDGKDVNLNMDRQTAINQKELKNYLVSDFLSSEDYILNQGDNKPTVIPTDPMFFVPNETTDAYIDGGWGPSGTERKGVPFEWLTSIDSGVIDEYDKNPYYMDSDPVFLMDLDELWTMKQQNSDMKNGNNKAQYGRIDDYLLVLNSGEDDNEDAVGNGTWTRIPDNGISAQKALNGGSWAVSDYGSIVEVNPDGALTGGMVIDKPKAIAPCVYLNKDTVLKLDKNLKRLGETRMYNCYVLDTNAPIVNVTDLPNGTVGLPYKTKIDIIGNNITSVDITKATLDGLSISKIDNEYFLQGTPMTYTLGTDFGVRAINDYGVTQSDFRITINKADTAIIYPTITNQLVYRPDLTLQEAILSQPMTQGVWAWENRLDNIGDAGQHEFYAIYHAKDINYNSYRQLIEVSVDKASGELEEGFVLPIGLGAKIGQTLQDIDLNDCFNGLTDVHGEWAWNDGLDTIVGSIGVNEFSATYVPYDDTNYTPYNTQLAITVSNKDIPSFSIKNILPIEYDPTQTLDSAKITIELQDNANDTQGTIAWVDSTQLVGSFGNNYHIAHFIPTDNSQYQDMNISVSVFVKKASGEKELGYTIPQDYTIREGSALNTLQLPNQWQWVDPNLKAVYGQNQYKGIYSPTDPINYTTVVTDITITVNKKMTPSPTIPSITQEYRPNLTLKDLVIPKPQDGVWHWENSTLALGNASSVEKSFNAQFEPSDTINYAVLNTQINVKVTKASGNKEQGYKKPTGLRATIGYQLNSVELPNSWQWIDDGTTVFEKLGIVEMHARYQPMDATNYTPYDTTISIQVDNKKQPIVTVPNTITVTYNKDAKLQDLSLDTMNINSRSSDALLNHQFNNSYIKDSELTRGVWQWDKPQTLIGQVGEYEHTIVFLPDKLQDFLIVYDSVKVIVTKCSGEFAPDYNKPDYGIVLINGVFSGLEGTQLKDIELSYGWEWVNPLTVLQVTTDDIPRLFEVQFIPQDGHNYTTVNISVKVNVLHKIVNTPPSNNDQTWRTIAAYSGGAIALFLIIFIIILIVLEQKRRAKNQAIRADLLKAKHTDTQAMLNNDMGKKVDALGQNTNDTTRLSDTINYSKQETFSNFVDSIKKSQPNFNKKKIKKTKKPNFKDINK